jgi:branched-chain amino acid transport system substrate-binding protein
VCDRNNIVIKGGAKSSGRLTPARLPPPIEGDTRMTMTRRRVLAASLAAPLVGRSLRANAEEPVWIGVSGPLTGPNAQYGAQWKDGFELALDEVGHKTGSRPLQYDFEDSQSDPRQSVPIAQKFAADPKIVLELGDFSSPASMAASPIYQRAGLVQFGFTNSHPDFTKGGDCMWSTSISQADEQPKLAEYAIHDLGLKRLAVLHLNTDWGRTSKDIFVKAVPEQGGTVVATEGYLPDEKDFRPTLVRVRDANPDGLILIAYYADAALVARQVRDQGLKQPMVAASSVYSPKLIELGGDAVNGLYTHSPFSSADPRPEVQSFVKSFSAKYGKDPDAFNAYSYDAMIMAHAVITEFGADRASVHAGFAKVKDVPSVIFGKATFDPTTRRVAKPRYTHLEIENGKFVAWDGTPPAKT